MTVIAAAILFIGVGASLAFGAARHSGVQPNNTVFYQASTSGSVIEGENDGSGVAVNGIVGTTAGSIGMLGFATSLTNADLAMEGLAWGPSSVGLYGQGLHNTDTTHPTIGLLGTSTSGIGVEGESLVANTSGVEGLSNDGTTAGQLGVGGEWGVHGALNTTTGFAAAVDGEPATTGTFSGGTFGLGALLGATDKPAYGVIGGGSLYGILGGGAATGASTSAFSSGVEGYDPGNSSFPDYNNGVLATSNYGIGLLAVAGGTSQSFRPTSFSTGLWVDGGNTGTSSSYAVGEEIEGADASTDELYIYNDGDARHVVALPVGTDVLRGSGPTGSFFFDGAGNESITGLITTGGVCNGGCAPPHSVGGRRMVTYAAQTTEPTVEDYGEAQLVNGVAHVALESRFASKIDGTRSYLVFLTPEDDNRGLYVTNRTPRGFMVREAQGGRSSIGFMYRIVAKPFGVDAARLPMVDMPGAPAQSEMPHGRPPHYLDPYHALVQRVGKAQADRLVAQYLRRIQDAQMQQQLGPHVDSRGYLHLGSTVVRPPTP